MLLPVNPRIKEILQREQQERQEFDKKQAKSFANSMGLHTKAGRKIMREGRRAFEIEYNAADVALKEAGKIFVGCGATE
ncbi:MAG: hypothetical protein ABSD98_16010 [Candidatus Korobacteraceae bacterium]|jgi:hypothetical protein